MNTVHQQQPSPRRNGAVVAMCLAFAGGMAGMSFAAVPLYNMFCRVTGYNGTTQRVEQVSDVVLDRRMTVTFDANVAAGLPWEFKPVQRDVKPRIGETVEVRFVAKNTSDKPTRGQAIFNVTPMEAGAYFNKVQCFCFTETELKPGETMEMPVVFYIDPDITKAVETKDIGTLTLSYTFYPHEGSKPVALKADGAVEAGKKL
ncbi:cytochrome c oxidase assembly protein [Rhizobiaceae bacterium n13]|uniref:Cytochrome c oxidase assembly protein CtaG n=1 Tax=Ferirhizobium litorale TaxID=2927786 RepID=A0AAE3QE52_9HYPH|nr:cytochrome c oxidase assembly protein [Fererhizobium litorale]MDI7861427.1 cytochrome c oxidase assembly protein [Fererhizobium litorale]MDI7921574.1 cytochrome c oxidase assembly protein [Fererhizobium litorale]